MNSPRTLIVAWLVAVSLGCALAQPSPVPLGPMPTPGPLPELPRHEIQQRIIPGGVLLVSAADHRLPLTSFRLAFRREDCRYGGLSNDQLATLIRDAIASSDVLANHQLIVRSTTEGLSLGGTTLSDTSLKTIRGAVETLQALDYRVDSTEGVEGLQTHGRSREDARPGEIARRLFLQTKISPQHDGRVNPPGHGGSNQRAALILVGDYPMLDGVRQSVEAAELGRLLPPGCPSEHPTRVAERLFVDRPDLDRVHFAIGTKLASRRDSGYLAAIVFSMAIKQRLRHRLPKTALSSAIIPGRRASQWLLRAESPIDEAPKVMAQLLEEMHTMEHVGLTDSEFQQFYRRILQTVPGQFETRDQWAQALSSLFIYGLDVSRPFAPLDRLRAVGLSGVNTQLKEQLAGHRLRAIGVGPWVALGVDESGVQQSGWSFVNAVSISRQD